MNGAEGCKSGSINFFLSMTAEAQFEARQDNKNSARSAHDRSIHGTAVQGEQEKIAQELEEASKMRELAMEGVSAAVTVVTGGIGAAVAIGGAIAGVATCWTGIGAVAGGAAAGGGGLLATLGTAASALASTATTAGASAIASGVAEGAAAGLALAPAAMLNAAKDAFAGSMLTMNPVAALPNMVSSAAQSGASSVIQGGIEGGLQAAGDTFKNACGETAKTVAGEGAKNAAGEGAKTVAGEGAKNAAGEGAKNVAGEGAKNVAGEGAKDAAQEGGQGATKTAADRFKEATRPIEEGKAQLEKAAKRGQQAVEGYDNMEKRETEARKRSAGTAGEVASIFAEDAGRAGQRLAADKEVELAFIEVQREVARSKMFA